MDCFQGQERRGKNARRGRGDPLQGREADSSKIEEVEKNRKREPEGVKALCLNIEFSATLRNQNVEMGRSPSQGGLIQRGVSNTTQRKKDVWGKKKKEVENDTFLR